MDPMYDGAGDMQMDSEFRRYLNGYGRNECSRPQDIQEAIQRGIEKERIREEIIMSEIVRRRVLEAEVRRELMMEREMALRQGSDGFPFGSLPLMGLELPVRPSLLVTKPEGWSPEERLGMALEDKEKLKRSENGVLETLTFQRGFADLRISEIQPASEGNKEKERILLLPKPDENVSRLKMKDVTPPEVVDIELHADVIANKISKEEWSCALCQVMASSEKGLNEHLFGQNHKLKVAALRSQRTGKNYRIGLFPKKGVKLKYQSLSSQKAGKATSKKDVLPLLVNPKSEHLEKTQAEVIQKIQKNEDDPRKKVQKNENDPRKKGCKVQKNENDPRKKGCRLREVMNVHKLGNVELPADVNANKKSKEEWRCSLCQVIATSEKDLNEHVLGKKHKSKVAALRVPRTGEKHVIRLSRKKATKSSHVKEVGVKLKTQSLFSEKAGEATSKKDDLPLLENPESEHLKKTQAKVIRKVQKYEDDPRKKVQKNENDPKKQRCRLRKVTNVHKFGNVKLPADVNANKKSKEEWRCALCQVIATSEKDLNEHMHGKKHKSKVAALRS